MTTTTHTPPSDRPNLQRHPRRRRLLISGAAVVLVGGLGVGLGLGLDRTPSATTNGSMQSYYQSMMDRYGLSNSSSMMGGGSGSGSMMGTSGYGWMMGGSTAPGWMNGDALPGAMMGTNTDAGQVMGRLFADAPGPRVSTATATTLGTQAPAGATVDRTGNRITFSGQSVQFTAVTSPTGGPDETYRVAGLVNPTISVPEGAHVSIELINADNDTAHGLVVTAAVAPFPTMPMMSAQPAFAGAALWFLGEPTSSGLHEATISFRADRSGSYSYLCAVPGHAQKGMVGSFLVVS